ncbi:MAG: NINE protein [Cyanobacteria bacterium P01_A01_bin.123]
MNKHGTAYLLWIGWVFGVAGLHRIYNGKIVSGLVWMFTFGLFGIGQIVDLLLIPEMVESHNDRYRLRHGLTPQGIPLQPSYAATAVVESRLTTEDLMLQLLKSAQKRQGRLSVTQGVIDTGAPFSTVEATLKDMLKTGYVDIDNDPDSGVVVYHFKEL